MSQTYTVRTRLYVLTGVVIPAYYAGDRWALALLEDGADRPEVLSTNLVAYGFDQPAGHVHVGTYAQHEGVPEALEAAGIATKVGDEPVSFGGHDASAWLMKLSDEVVAEFEKAKEARA
jgi:hypothetical protein